MVHVQSLWLQNFRNYKEQEIGFGLGVTIGDVNMDDWPDIYVSNDFFEKDYLYINNKDKTFSENSSKYFKSNAG